MNTAVAGTSKLNADELISKSLHVETMLTANVATYATPNPSVVQLAAGRSALSTAIANAMDGGRELVRLRNEAARALRLLLTREAAYVNGIAQGDADKIGLSGFELRKTPSPLGLLAPPSGLVLVMTGVQGSLKARWKARYGAGSYNVFFTSGNPSDPKTTWDLAGVTTKANFVMDGLTPGTFYAFAVTAVGAAGESGMSEPAVSVAA